MSLETIPIHVAAAGPAESGLSGNAPPLLRELLDRVRQLLEQNEASTIDLSALPLTPGDLEWLRDRLGQGEIHVTLDANGESTLVETHCPGVWWVTHKNPQGAVLAQFLEVAFVPELVKADPQDVKNGYEYLELLIADS